MAEREEVATERANSEELALLQRVCRYDRDALTVLYTRYHGRLFKFVYRLTRSHSIAEELVNDVMLVIWRKAGDFRGESRVSTWVLGIAYRLAMRRLGRRRLRLSRQRQLAGGEVETMSSLEIEDWVRSGLEALPPIQKVTVVLVFYLGLSYDEVAQVTGCPVNTVKTRMFHARKKLRHQLGPRDGE